MGGCGARARQSARGSVPLRERAELRSGEHSIWEGFAARRARSDRARTGVGTLSSLFRLSLLFFSPLLYGFPSPHEDFSEAPRPAGIRPQHGALLGRARPRARDAPRARDLSRLPHVRELLRVVSGHVRAQSIAISKRVAQRAPSSRMPQIFQSITELCWQCKLCYIDCPYTPDQGHEWLLDIPRLLMREKAQRAKRNGVTAQDKALGEPGKARANELRTDGRARELRERAVAHFAK